MKKLALAAFLAISLAAVAQTSRPSVYIEPQDGFETYLAAAMAKKHVPADIVIDAKKATYVLKSAPVEIKQESTGGKIAGACSLIAPGLKTRDLSLFSLWRLAQAK